jgi:transglutaminase-like putative cysteine protease
MILWNPPDLDDGPEPPRLLDIPDGAAGIFATLPVMRQFIREGRCHPHVIAMARCLVQTESPKNRHAEIRRLFHFVRDHVRYVADVVDTETVFRPEITLRMRCGDCDDKVVLLASLLESIGIRTCMVVGGYNVAGVWEHVYLRAEVTDGCGDYIGMDPTEDEALGWEPDNPVCLWVETC